MEPVITSSVDFLMVVNFGFDVNKLFLCLCVDLIKHTECENYLITVVTECAECYNV